jgi:hypothetical protein
MNKFYVYLYLDINDEPFYVGKGSGNRVKISKTKLKQQPFLKNKIDKVGIDNVKIHFLNENITEEEAFMWERYWIKYIGRRSKKEGSLCNLTDGGEGHSGFVQSEDTRKKRRELMIGNLHALGSKHPNKKLSEQQKTRLRELRTGCKHTVETKQKMSQSRMGRIVSEETRMRMSVAKKGQPSARKGTTLPEAVKKKISETKRTKKHDKE